MLMRQPAGGLGDPAIPAEACLLCRVPIYASIDAGRGFYLRMDSEVKSAGMKASKVMPALYYHQDENGDLHAMLCTHVDDLLFAHKPSGAKDFSIEIDAEENTRGIKPILIDKTRKGSEKVTEKELTSLRSVVGSLAWVARYCRADLAYKAGKQGRELAHLNQNLKLVCKSGWIDWKDLAVVTYSDASFANEEGYKSQQGRVHYLTTAKNLEDNEHNVHIIGYASSTLKRVCRATLQAERYDLQNGVEPGDRLRCVLFEMTGKLQSMTDWHEQCQRCMKHVWVSNCMRLVEHLNAEVPKQVPDKRLGIELAALRQSLWTGNSQRSSQEYSPHVCYLGLFKVPLKPSTAFSGAVNLPSGALEPFSAEGGFNEAFHAALTVVRSFQQGTLKHLQEFAYHGPSWQSDRESAAEGLGIAAFPRHVVNEAAELKVFANHNAIVDMASREGEVGRRRHLDGRFLWSQQRNNRGFQLRRVGTISNPADWGQKTLEGNRMKFLLNLSGFTNDMEDLGYYELVEEILNKENQEKIQDNQGTRASQNRALLESADGESEQEEASELNYNAEGIEVRAEPETMNRTAFIRMVLHEEGEEEEAKMEDIEIEPEPGNGHAGEDH
eukprot:s3272_g15.t2